MNRRVSFSPEAATDLIEIYDYIALHGGADRALAYVERIAACCRGLADFPARGRPRDDLRDGLRVLPFQRRATIAFHVAAASVTILRILHAGRDVEATLVEPDD